MEKLKLRGVDVLSLVTQEVYVRDGLQIPVSLTLYPVLVSLSNSVFGNGRRHHPVSLNLFSTLLTSLSDLHFLSLLLSLSVSLSLSLRFGVRVGFSHKHH